MIWALIIITIASSDDHSIHKEEIGIFKTKEECEQAAGAFKWGASTVCIKRDHYAG